MLEKTKLIVEACDTVECEHSYRLKATALAEIAALEAECEELRLYKTLVSKDWDIKRVKHCESLMDAATARAESAERTAERDAARRELCRIVAIEKCPAQLGVATGEMLLDLPILKIPRRRKDWEYWERDYAQERGWSYLYEQEVKP